VVAALVVLAVLVVAAFAVRRRSLTRVRGAFDCSVRVAGGSWTQGVAHFGSSRVEWWKVFSLSPRPGCTWGREDLTVVERHLVTGADAGGVLPEAVLVRCDHGGTELDLAMGREAYTGFASWLESAPPGPTSSVT
jgi:hypothetical protein